jgi:hypothetical protein
MTLRQLLLILASVAVTGVLGLVALFAGLSWLMGPLPGEPLASDQRAFRACATAFGPLYRRTGAIAFVGTGRALEIRLPGETVSPAELLRRFPDAGPALDALRGAEPVCTSFLILPDFGSLSVVWLRDERIGGMGSMGIGRQPVLKPFHFDTDYIADDYLDDTVNTQYWSADAALLDHFDATPVGERERGEVLAPLSNEEAQAALAAPRYVRNEEYNTRGFEFATPLARVTKTAVRTIQRVKPVTPDLATSEVVARLVDVYAPSETWDYEESFRPDPLTEIFILPRGTEGGRPIAPVRLLPLDPEEQRMMMLPAGPAFLAQFRLDHFRHGDEVEFRYGSGRTKRREIYLNGVR